MDEDGTISCPSDPTNPVVDEAAGSGLPASSCNFGTECSLRSPTLPQYVCGATDLDGDPGQGDYEVTIMNSGSATTVPVFVEAEEDEDGHVRSNTDFEELEELFRNTSKKKRSRR